MTEPQREAPATPEPNDLKTLSDAELARVGHEANWAANQRIRAAVSAEGIAAKLDRASHEQDQAAFLARETAVNRLVHDLCSAGDGADVRLPDLALIDLRDAATRAAVVERARAAGLIGAETREQASAIVASEREAKENAKATLRAVEREQARRRNEAVEAEREAMAEAYRRANR